MDVAGSRYLFHIQNRLVIPGEDRCEFGTAKSQTSEDVWSTKHQSSRCMPKNSVIFSNHD